MALYIGSSEKYKGNMCVVEDAALRKEIEDAKKEIEEATGESYEDLTEAVKSGVDIAGAYHTVTKNYIEILKSPNAVFREHNGKKLPRIDVSNGIDWAEFCISSTIEEIDYYLDFASNKPGFRVNLHSAFRYTKNLKRMVGMKTDMVYSCPYMFQNSGIEVIEQPLDFSYLAIDTAPDFREPFLAAYYLREIRFIEETIPKSINFGSRYLSNDSIQSIIDGLRTLSGGANTLTFSSTIKAKLTDEQITMITNKNWNLA
jgi:hypothetical protein